MTSPRTSFAVLLISVLVSAALLASPASAAVLVSSTFNTDIDGWGQVFTATDPNAGGSLTYLPTGPNGQVVTWNASGYISTVGDTVDWSFFSAPSKFLGNESAAYGGTLSWDLQTGANTWYKQPYPGLILTGGGETLFYKWSPSDVNPSFQSFSATLTPSSSWAIGTSNGAQPTIGQMQTCLSSLTGMYIYNDWDASYHPTSLDNVILAAPTPEPATLALMAVGGGALLIRRWGRKSSVQQVH